MEEEYRPVRVSDLVRKFSIKTNPEDTRDKEKELLVMFDELKSVLESEEFDENLRKCLNASNPGYLEVIEKRKKDIMKSDHGIVIAGETSAGKSTLVNKILGKRIFKARNYESTSTICKIRNSENVRIITEHANGETNVIPLINCSLETKEGEKAVRDTLKQLTDLTASRDSKHFRSVDIGFPIPFLEGNTIIVDTPGIGGSGEVSEKLIEYLPNALSCIFVINVGSAGGMQRDRLPEILKSILQLQMDNEMPCFDARDVIFITNKWDAIISLDEDSSDEDDREKTWNVVTKDIKEQWPTVKMENIFQMNLRDVHPGQKNYSTKEFQKFRRCLEKVIKSNEYSRIAHNGRYLQELLKNVKKAIKARLELGKRNEKEQRTLEESHQQKINDLKRKCNEKRNTLRSKIHEVIEKKADECYDYMATDEGKYKVLNPEGQRPIMEVSYYSNMNDEIKRRVELFINRSLESKTLQSSFGKIYEQTMEFYNEVCMELSEMENDWTGDHTCDPAEQGRGQELSLVPFFAGAIATSPLWLPLLAAGAVLAVAAIGVTIVAAPIVLPTLAILSRDAKKKKRIDEEYESCKSTVRSTVCNKLQSSYGELIDRLILNITENSLPKRIAFLEKLIEQLSENRQQVLANQGSLTELARKIEEIGRKTAHHDPYAALQGRP